MLAGLENPFHLPLVVLLVLLVFGAKRLPEMGRSLGTGIRDFKEGLATGSVPEPASTTPAVAASSAGDPAARAE
jgi:sec-independent protein translocase protein TatA